MSPRITALLFGSTFALLSAGALAAAPTATQGTVTGSGMTTPETGENARGAEREAGQLPDSRSQRGAGSENEPGATGEGSSPGTLDRSAPPIGGSMGEGTSPGTIDRSAPPTGGSMGGTGQGSSPGTLDRRAPPTGGSMDGMGEDAMDDMDRDGALRTSP